MPAPSNSSTNAAAHEAAAHLGSANWTSAGLGDREDDRRNFELGWVTRDRLVIETTETAFCTIWDGHLLPDSARERGEILRSPVLLSLSRRTAPFSGHVERSRATASSQRMPHTWLSLASSSSYVSTASLRHVRGSPARGLLRRLRPSSETSPDLVACQEILPALGSRFPCSTT